MGVAAWGVSGGRAGAAIRAGARPLALGFWCLCWSHSHLRPCCAPCPALPHRACVVVRTWSSSEAGWHPSKGEASSAAADKALDAAEELGEELENWSCVKVRCCCCCC